MHCSEFQQRLDTLLDERREPASDSRLTAHAAKCSACREHLACHTALFAGLAKVTTPALSADFAQHVVAIAAPALTVSARPRRAIWPTIAAALASAAAMLLAVSILWFARQREPDLADGAEGAKNSAGPQLPFRGFAVATPPSTSRPIARRSNPSVTSADILLQGPRLPNRLREYRVAIDELALSLPQAARRLSDIEQLAPGIRPLRASLAMIWDVFCGAIPSSGRGDPPQPPPDSTSLSLLQSLLVA